MEILRDVIGALLCFALVVWFAHFWESGGFVRFMNRTNGNGGLAVCACAPAVVLIGVHFSDGKIVTGVILLVLAIVAVVVGMRWSHIVACIRRKRLY